MAEIEYTELSGNESILRAVEYLRMLPEWKAKPGKLRSGFVEFGEVISRHLVNLYCNLEGKPLDEKIELSELINPLLQEQVAQGKLLSVVSAVGEYDRQLNCWHLELAMLRDLVNHLLLQFEEDWTSSAAHICRHRFDQLIDSCPFPNIKV